MQASDRGSAGSVHGIDSTVRRYPRAMIATLKTFARVVATPVHLKRTLLIAFLVG